jgi:hypothetical protein
MAKLIAIVAVIPTVTFKLAMYSYREWGILSGT